MKMIILSLVAIFALSTSSFATVNNNVNDNTVNSRITRMEKVLNMDGYQSSAVKDAGIKLQEAIETAMQESNENDKATMVKTAVQSNLKKTGRVLTREQYKKYLQIMNVTLLNNGLAKYTK